MRTFITSLVLSVAIITQAQTFRQIEPGVYLLAAGQEDAYTPLRYKEPVAKQLKDMPATDNPFAKEGVHIEVNARGCVVDIPLAADENIYGFGLQMGSFVQNNKKKRPLVNDHPLKDLGYTHAPQPFYISNKGYAVLINTARYTTFYIGTNRKNTDYTLSEDSQKAKLSTDELYRPSAQSGSKPRVQVDIPGAKGISVLVFAGPDMNSALRRYNLFAGGGSMPALWGLGMKFRLKTDSKQEDAYRIAHYLRNKHIPCDVIGLEPKWQTQAYSCSYVWNKDNFPNPNELISRTRAMGYKLNLWEHAFVHPSSPLHPLLKAKAGSHLVWNGLVPDFADSTTQRTFAAYHDTCFVQKGIAAFKMDECDNANITRGDLNWSFPELSSFPSGIDGEQMHQLFGLLYQKTLYGVYRKHGMRTCLDVRASGALAAPYPVSIYSDTYDLEDYVRMVCNAGLTGLLWSPEVRESADEEDFFRRVQVAVLSAQTLFNGWYLRNPVWLQFDKQLNNEDKFLPTATKNEDVVRQLLNFRMSLVPYLYAQFAHYRTDGTPPFKPLVLNYPKDKAAATIDNQFLIGDDLLACPIVGKGNERTVYLPEGSWYNFNTNEKLEGGRSHNVHFALHEVPLFVREGTILPLAEPTDCITPQTTFVLNCRVYGKQARNTSLFEDDGISYGFESGIYNKVLLSWNGRGNIKRTGKFKGVRYKVKSWTLIE